MAGRGDLAIEALYLNRPTPEYSRAFDRAAASLEHADGPALVVASSPVHAVEFLKRCRRDLAFVFTGPVDGDAFVRAVAPWAWGAIRELPLTGAGPAFAAIAWAEPEAASAAQVAARLAARSLPGAALYIIATTWLRRFLPAWQGESGPATRPLSPGRALRTLAAAGWRGEVAAAYHGPRAVAWTAANRLCEGLGRPDWADRCRLAMWASYGERGWLWPFAPLALISARLA